MSISRAIAVLLIVLGCVMFSQVCLVTALASGSQGSDCCEEEPSGGGCGEANCAACTTLENGANKDGVERLTAEAPVFAVDDMLSAVMRLIAAQMEAMPALDTSPPPELTSLWHFVVCTALPVRGPALIA